MSFLRFFISSVFLTIACSQSLRPIYTKNGGLFLTNISSNITDQVMPRSPWIYVVVRQVASLPTRYQIFQKALDPSSSDQLVVITNKAGAPVALKCETWSMEGVRISFPPSDVSLQHGDVLIFPTKKMRSQGVTCVIDIYSVLHHVNVMPMFMLGMTDQIMEVVVFETSPVYVTASYNDLAEF